jgi:hypothetical protein
MTEQQQPEHQGHQTDAEAHPAQALDELEERVLGRQMDQIQRDDDNTDLNNDLDEPGPVAEQP